MVRWNGTTILMKDPELVIQSDALTQGWGATCQVSDTSRPWSTYKKTCHINCLELLAAKLVLKTFVKNRTTLSVLLKLDNTSAVAYINNQGGTVSKKLVSLARDLWMWCLERNIPYFTVLTPGSNKHLCSNKCLAKSLTIRNKRLVPNKRLVSINRLGVTSCWVCTYDAHVLVRVLMATARKERHRSLNLAFKLKAIELVETKSKEAVNLGEDLWVQFPI